MALRGRIARRARGRPGSRRLAGAASLGQRQSHAAANPGDQGCPLHQNRKDEGVAVLSANFTCGSFSPTCNSAGADDFVVPGGQTWAVTEADAPGQYFNGDGFDVATGEDVYFYKDFEGKPGRQKGAFTYLKGADTNGNFAIVLPARG
jgi:hypothetical protein